jgi:hypothetical protein
MVSLGYMLELVRGSASWWHPTLLGEAPSSPALLPYWLGAWAIQASPSFWAPDFAAKLPFIALLGLTMFCTWYSASQLARSRAAQPVAFAFGGEAQPKDYARAMGDAALLACIACLGLAQLSHESTPALAQLACTALLFCGLCTLTYKTKAGWFATTLGAIGLTLSGAPAITMQFILGAALLHAMERPEHEERAAHAVTQSLVLVFLAALTACIAWGLSLWRWKVELPEASWTEWRGYLELLIWFLWPAWPLAIWTVWRWRRQLFNRSFSKHIALPLWFVMVCLLSTLFTGSPDRSLLLALPALAALAAFALPTLQRQVSALIDWFTLLFFSGCGLIIWVVWIAMQTGSPPQPAANVARLAPGFTSVFSWTELCIAVLATACWAWLVHWRVGRHRAAMWKSLVLPSAGAALCWLLLMTLWMPLLNYAQSYRALLRPFTTSIAIPQHACIATQGLNQGQVAALQWYLPQTIRRMGPDTPCAWLLVQPDPTGAIPQSVDLRVWKPSYHLQNPVESSESLWLLER